MECPLGMVFMILFRDLMTQCHSSPSASLTSSYNRASLTVNGGVRSRPGLPPPLGAQYDVGYSIMSLNSTGYYGGFVE